jgi:glucose-6-phosphate isomerase
MADLRTDYQDDVLDASENTARVYDLVDSNGNVVLAGVHLEDKTVYTTEGDDYGAADINNQNTKINQINADLAGKTLGYVNSKAMEGTILAHVTGNVPNFKVEMERLDEENLGELIYFFEKAVAISGNLLGVNPFNQPGVEEYKKNMFKLLEKPGY